MQNYFYLSNVNDHDSDFMKNPLEKMEDQQFKFPSRNIADPYREDNIENSSSNDLGMTSSSNLESELDEELPLSRQKSVIEDLGEFDDIDNINVDRLFRESETPNQPKEKTPILLEDNANLQNDELSLLKDTEDSEKRSEDNKTEQSTILNKRISKRQKNSTPSKASFSKKKANRKNRRTEDKGTFDKEYLNYSPGNNFFLAGEPAKRSYVKKHAYLNYSELLGEIPKLSKFNWFETKLSSSKFLTPNVIWFLWCSNYFPKNAFAHKNKKEFIHQRFKKIQNFMPDIAQRLDKEFLQTENITKKEFNPSELEKFNQFTKAIKAKDYIRTNDFLEKIMRARTTNIVLKPEYTSKDDEWIAETKTFLYENFESLENDTELSLVENIDLLSKIETQDLINLYEKQLYQSTLGTEERLATLEQDTFKELTLEDYLYKHNFDANDSLVDLRTRYHEEDTFLGLLERKQNEAKELERMEIEMPSPKGLLQTGRSVSAKTSTTLTKRFSHYNDERLCQICNEDSSSQDTMISCSECEMSVHQYCYGLSSYPKGDWVCNLCQEFGEQGNHLRCPFCTMRGGAMKVSTLKADTNIFEVSNPSFHNFLKSYANKEINQPSKKNRSLKSFPSIKSTSTVLMTDKKQEKVNQDEQPTLDIKEDEPQPNNIWVHITCALFIPELYFKDSSNVNNVSGLETVGKEKFNHECSVCHFKNAGAVVHCAKSNCKLVFHAECARREGYYLDLKESDQPQFSYHIYCNKHFPLKLKIVLEDRKSQMKREIENFFRNIDRFYMSSLSQPKSAALSIIPTPTTPIENKLLKRMKKQSQKNDSNYFMKLVEKYKDILAKRPAVITLEKTPTEESEELFRILDIKVPTNPALENKKLQPHDDLWKILPYKQFTPEQKYEKYKKILEKAKKSKNVKHADKSDKAALRKNSLKLKESEKAGYGGKDTTRYCTCNKPYKGELMIECEDCGNWYHPKCVGLPKNTNLKNLKWYCSDCQKKRSLTPSNMLPQNLQKRRTENSLEEEENPLSKKIKTEKRTSARLAR